MVFRRGLRGTIQLPVKISRFEAGRSPERNVETQRNMESTAATPSGSKGSICQPNDRSGSTPFAQVVSGPGAAMGNKAREVKGKMGMGQI